MRKTASKKAKKKKISITLPEREGEMLKSYAKAHHTTCPAAVRKMVKMALRQYKAESDCKASPVPQNQLNLFDSLQVDIFNNTSKTGE